MNTKEINDQMEEITDHLDKADNDKHPTGNLIIAIGKLMTINHGLLARIEHLEKEVKANERPAKRNYSHTPESRT